MNKDVQLDREFLHTHLAHPAAHSLPPPTRPLHLRVLRPGTQACRSHFIATQDCPSLALPSKEHPGPLARGCLTSLCQTLGGPVNKACCNLSHQDWWGRWKPDSEEAQARNLIPGQEACLVQWCMDPDLGQAQRWGGPVTRGRA